jgi:hypothetical protein
MAEAPSPIGFSISSSLRYDIILPQAKSGKTSATAAFLFLSRLIQQWSGSGTGMGNFLADVYEISHQAWGNARSNPCSKYP